MIVVEWSIIQEWFCRHSIVKNALILLICFLLAYSIFIRDVVLRYRESVLLEKSLFSQVMANKKIIDECEEQKKRQEMKLIQNGMGFDLGNEFKMPSLAISDFYNKCGIEYYSIIEANGSSSGGQGRPILSVISRLHYAQVLCVLSNFSKRSEDIEFLGMALGRDEKDHYLKFILDVGVGSEKLL